MSGLLREIDAVYEGRADPPALLGEFRRALVLSPLAGDGRLWAADLGGLRWLYAFTSPQALARFAAQRGEGDREWDYLTVYGARMLDVAVPATGVPTGVAVDVGGPRSMMLPPVRGVVPDGVALETDRGEGGLGG